MGPELAIAGWFASAAISQLIGLAFSYIREQPVWLKMKEELEELHAALVPIRAVVEKVEKLQIINDCTPAQEAWLWQLKDAVDGANDVLDELEYHKLEEDVQSGGEKVRATASNYTKKIMRSTTFSLKHAKGLKKKLKKAVKNLLRVADSAGDFLKFHDLSNEYEKRQQQIRAHESGCLLTEDKVFGREKEKEKIVEWLKKSGSGEHESSVKKNVTLLPIVGLPGIGKTTLAQLVYGEGSFDLRMWVCVSNYFDVTVIMRKMIQEAAITERQAEAVSTLQKIIAEELKSKKFLLVLDDVWNDGDRKKWKDLVAPLQYGKQGSKILLTTRMNSVAEMIGKVMEGTEEPMNLQGIEWSEYLSLFNKHAFDGVDTGDHEKLQLIGEQIAKNLGQSPLLARTVGGMLNSNLSVEFWNEVLEDGVFNSIQNEDFQPILRLNYIHLSPQLQQCFRYCSIFPQDHAFRKDELVRMWMAVGLIQQDDKKRRPEDIGGEYFDSLLRKSFFNLLQAYQFTYYVIHDLLHEMVCSVSEGECLGVDYSKPNPRNIPTTLRHLFIMVDDPRVLSKVPPLENLHSLVLTTRCCCDHKWDDILNKVLKGFKSLRVLKLESFGERKLESKLESLNAIGDLKHLRYLHLDMLVEGTQLPKSVCKLYHLQTMIVPSSDPSIGSIGKDMRSLINLRHLILPLEEITTIVEGGKLTALQELDEFYVRKENGCNIGALKHLRELRGTLSIRNLENVESYEDAMVADLLNKKHLRKLQLEWVYDSNSTPEVAAKVIDGLQPHSSLEDLEIFGYNGADPPRWLATQDLNMLGSITLKLLPPFEKLPFLKSLFLDDMKALTEVSFTTFPKLEVLNLWNIPQLEKWSGDGRWFPCLKSLSLRHMRALTEVSFTTFEKLEHLDFGEIPQLEKWSGVGDGPWFPCLKSLTIRDCSVLEQLPPLPHGMEALQVSDVGLTTLPRLWQCQNNDCGSPSPSKPGYLMIRSCPKLTSLARCLLQHADHFMDVEILSIENCKELVHLPVEGFQRFKSLRSLYISLCPRLQRHNAPHDDFFLPSSVEKIMIRDCGEMDASLLGAMQHLAYLSELFLSECTTITSLPSAKVFRGLKKLHELIIRECRELTSLGGLQALTSLKHLEIRGCPKLVEAAAAAVMPPLTSDPDERAADGSSLSLDMLELDDPSLLHLEPLRSLTSVQHLELRDCSRPTSLSEEWLLQVRSSLQQLSLLQAVSLRFLPGSLKELCSLQVLVLSGLPLLQSLPELPNSLKTLHIHDCNSKLEDLLLGQGWNMGLDHCFQEQIFTRNEAHN